MSDDSLKSRTSRGLEIHFNRATLENMRTCVFCKTDTNRATVSRYEGGAWDGIFCCDYCFVMTCKVGQKQTISTEVKSTDIEIVKG